MKWFDAAWNERPARGVVAVGKNAVGIVAIGVVATGVVSIGCISFGVVSVGILCAAIAAVTVGACLSVVTVTGLGVSFSATPSPLGFLGLSLPDEAHVMGLVSIAMFGLLLMFALRFRMRMWKAERARFDDVEAMMEEYDATLPETTDTAYLLRNAGTQGRVLGDVESIHKGVLEVRIWEYETWWNCTFALDPALAAKYATTLCAKSQACCDHVVPSAPRYVFLVQAEKPHDSCVSLPSPMREWKDDDVEIRLDSASDKAYSDGEETPRGADLVSAPLPTVLHCLEAELLTATQIRRWEVLEENRACSPLIWSIVRETLGSSAGPSSPSSLVLRFWETSSRTVTWMICVIFIALALSATLFAFPIQVGGLRIGQMGWRIAISAAAH